MTITWEVGGISAFKYQLTEQKQCYDKRRSTNNYLNLQLDLGCGIQCLLSMLHLLLGWNIQE